MKRNPVQNLSTWYLINTDGSGEVSLILHVKKIINIIFEH